MLAKTALAFAAISALAEQALAAPAPQVIVTKTVAQQAAAPTPQQAQAKSHKSDKAASAANVALRSKKGLAYNSADLANGLNCGEACGFGYNWDSAPNGLDPQYAYIPMLWNATDDHLANWDANVEAAISSGSPAIFSFNEPDNGGNANITPELAAQNHQQYMNKYQGRIAIGAPAVTNSGEPGKGIEFLRNFFNACGDACAVDFCNVHWYSEVQYSESLFEHLNAAHDACGQRPIWLTEFAPNPGSASNEQIISFMNDVIPRLRDTDFLDAFSYFWVDGDLANNPDVAAAYINA